MAYKIDERNKNLFAIVDDKIVPRSEASIPIWDAGFLHGKQIWSSPRLVNGKIFRLQDHLDKIRHGIQAMNCKIVPDDAVFRKAIRNVLVANKMQGATGVHIRIVYTPGTQVTASMNMKAVVNWDGTPAPPRIIVMPEWRGMGTIYDTVKGEKAIISQYRRPSPQFADQRIHSNNQIHSSLACDEAVQAGVAAALMLDADGFVAEAHASHMAIIKDGKFYTPHVRCCPPGVTRKVLLEVCQSNDIPAMEDDITVERLMDADEVMIMGTMSGPISITHVDGNVIGDGEIGPMTTRLKALYNDAMADEKNLFDIFAEEE
ncbi:acid aminotransferase-like protein 2 [Seminavis robusta]|uniref:Acid aminotransferase-like protein 2 n=1 Tax=Seminavis robusta TaxID=568900 RepID=A0A9N8DWB1_9STRA|nr:acid aminotransferase-like protein 2 [Seminavis robusta]|eukprot:Sro392_g133250.1 acid aminotransferase-like protein 2 (317) ;mRNA; f:757-1809